MDIRRRSSIAAALVCLSVLGSSERSFAIGRGSPPLLPVTERTSSSSNTTVTTVTASTADDFSTTSSTVPFDIRYGFKLGLYPTEPVRSLTVLVGWASYADIDCEPMGIGAAAPSLRSTSDGVEIELFFGEEGLRHSQRVLSCVAYVWHGDAWWEPQVAVLDARGLDGSDLDLGSSLCMDCATSRPRDWGEPDPHDYDSCGRNICGDVVADATFTASDALRVLQAALGNNAPKYPQQYDTDRSGRIAASDSLRVLRRSVGLPGDMFCAKPPAADCRLEWEGDVDTRLVRVSLVSSDAPVGSLQYRLTATAPGSFEGDGQNVSCASLVEGGLAAFQKQDPKTVSASVVTLAPLAAPNPVAECVFTAVAGYPPTAGHFLVSDVVATDGDAAPTDAALAVSVIDEP